MYRFDTCVESTTKQLVPSRQSECVMQHVTHNKKQKQEINNKKRKKKQGVRIPQLNKQYITIRYRSYRGKRDDL